MNSYQLSELRVRAVSACGNTPAGVEELRRRPDSATMRVEMPDGTRLVMKFWDRRGWRATARRLTRTTPSCREWRVMRRLWDRKVSIPRPIARFHLEAPGASFNEVLVMEDLGAVRTVQRCIKDAIAEGKADVVERLESDVIELTRRIVDAGVLDSDHSVMNIVCREDGRVYRLDFEVARLARPVSVRPILMAEMISRLVGTFVFTVQPDGERAARFAVSLAGELGASKSVRRRAKRVVDAMLEKQRVTRGVDSKFLVEW